MKIYFFDCVTGVYQGEGFEDETMAGTIDGATTVAPPPYGRGEIPVYQCRSRTWTVTTLPQKTKPHPTPD
ncbi:MULTISPECIES: hypothetical protein [Geobacter]|uniref:Uncharacterized protein n=2 Tax=Geobacter TaxID=28231 RepID=A0A0C1U1H8_9BACT|nr:MULTISPECIES: hypothetical protein [Geobacter]ANA39836.1 hypothetical protein A2G06_05200 [Geobacter anodireducens]KIE41655.1 hypothetical protein SE37_02945 [Geobacter soli]MBE2887434.1 hypothetical protein [Geobacter anodireducens]